MDYCYFRPSSRFRRLLLGAWLSLFSLPSFAAQQLTLSIEFSIAFVLGVSLPILVIVAVLRSVIEVKWWFPTLITLSLLGILSSIAYLVDYQALALLSFGIIFLSLLCLWGIKSSPKFQAKLINWLKGLNIACGLLYLLTLWFLPKVDAYNAWALIASVILLSSAISYWQIVKNTEVKAYRLILQWLVISAFAIAIYMWLITKLEMRWLVITSVLAYLVALINGCWLMIQGILEQPVVEEEKEQLSIDEMYSYTHDPATNLPTYQHALKAFDYQLKSSSEKKLAAIVFKPKNFQQVNTVLGHHNSDILLLQLAYCLQQKLADNSMLVNFGVQEQPVRIARLQSLNFLVLLDLSLSHHPEQSIIEETCQQLAKGVPDAMSFKSFSLNFELVFGVAIAPQHGNSFSEIIAHAGDALLQAEKSQQMLDYFNNDSLLYAEQQLLKMERLKQDIADENLRWYLQPQVALSDRRIRGFELMVHWYWRGEVPLELNEFIKTAEYSGEVYLLTKQMIKQAFQALFSLHKLGMYQPVSVNLSSRDLLEPDLVDFIELQISNFNIPAKYLLIELSERVMLSACGRAKSMIDQLKSLGVGISIDEFSGSYESLRYLRKMSIEQVKIDCGYLEQVEDNRADKAIINALINLTRSMQLPLVGTSVNSKEVEELFIAMGGEFAQGLATNRGVVLDELEIWLERWFKLHPQAKPEL